MASLERTLADYQNSGVTIGPHIMAYLRAQLACDGVLRACDLKHVRDGRWVKIAGLVIVRQRPGTAKGFCFLTLEDETGTANAVVVPDMFQRHRSLIHTAALLQVEGPLQKVGAGGQGLGSGSPTEKSWRAGRRRRRDQAEVHLAKEFGADSAAPSSVDTGGADPRSPTPDPQYVIHVRARRFVKLEIPRQAIDLAGHGYRMRGTPSDPSPQPPNPAILSPLPKSHDFR
jgi:DNA polymerase III alpha subunit